MDSPGRKRHHDEFAADLVGVQDIVDATPGTPVISTDSGACLKLSGSPALCVMVGLPASPDASQLSSDLARKESSARSMSESGPPIASSPSTPGNGANEAGTDATAPGDMRALDRPGSPKAMKKRKRLSPEEKEAREKELAKKKQEREEELQRKREERAKQEKEKEAKARDRKFLADEKTKARDEQKIVKARERDQKRREKEEEQRRAQEEQEKKLRSQPKLNNFFTVKSVQKETAIETKPPYDSPIKTAAEAFDAQVVPPAKSAYHQLFRPFYVKPDVRMAKPPAQADEEGRAEKASQLESFFAQARGEDDQSLLDGRLELRLPWKPTRRGRLHHPVRHIMEATATSGIDGLDVDVDGIDARKALAAIPVKTIAFDRDVRPAYRGTVTLQPWKFGRESMVRLARKPADRRLPLQYDYDSEAEWQEDEGEDVDVDDEEEEVDDEDDMDGFLDDSEELGLPRRVFAGTMEPESTGIWFEAAEGCEAVPVLLRGHRLEFMLGVSSRHGVDPWTAKYWQQEPARNVAKLAAPADPGSQAGSPRAAADAFAVLRNPNASPVRLVKSELLNDIKKAILDNKALSKVGMVDIIFHQFRDSVSRLEVRNTIELVAEKKGIGRIKMWGLKPGHDITL